MSIWSFVKKAYTAVTQALSGNKPVTPSPVPAGMVGTPTTTGATQPAVTTTPTTTSTNPQPTVTTTPTTTGTTPKTTTTTGGSSPAVTQPAAQPQASQPQAQPAVQPQTFQAPVQMPAQSTTSSSTSTTPTTTSQSQYRQVQVKNPDGTTTPTWIDKNKSYIGQTGQFEFDFWTAEGQAERLKNALDTATLRFGTTTAIGGKYVPVASEETTVLIDALNVAAILNAAADTFNFLKGAAAVGEIAKTGGPALAELAGNIPEASGIVSKVVPALEAAENTKNWLITLKYIGSVAKAVKTPIIAVGILASLITTKVAVSQAGRVAVGNDLNTFNDKWLSHAQDLRDAGMTDMADELATCAQDVKDALDSGAYNNIFTGKRKGLEAVNACNAKLATDLDAYNAKVSADAKKKIADATAADQQAADIKRQQDLADLADKRAYDAATLADKRAYDEAQAAQDAVAKTAATAEQRTYNEQQQAQQDQQQAAADAAAAQAAAGVNAGATQTAQPSTLTFGLLHTSGAQEFVDKDKAAQFYFQKSYDELTPEQQMLLNLLKGTGE